MTKATAPDRGDVKWAWAGLKTDISESADELYRQLQEDERTRNDLYEQVRQFLKCLGVLCLTESYNNLLMWAHYADSHKGAVLRFDTQRLKGVQECRPGLEALRGCSIFELAQVRYRSHPPRAHSKGLSAMLETILLRKSKEWAYEREWRICRYLANPSTNGVNLVELDSGALNGVYIGAQVAGACKLALEDTVQELRRTTAAEVFEMQLHRDFYELRVAQRITRNGRTHSG